jgi:60 kDa SS-A/Ro ribonucleoprotein
VKYRQRNGWTHADMLRLAHVAPPAPAYDALFRWITHGDMPEDTSQLRMLDGYARLQAATRPRDAAQLIVDYRLPREAVPTQYLDSAVLMALRTYASGRGLRGRNTWTPVQQVVDALDAAFYTAFDNVQPTGQRLLLGVDCSGSMMCGTVAGVAGLTPREAAGAMALIALRTEPSAEVIGFTTSVKALRISPRHRLDDVVSTIAGVSRPEGTDCSIPMRWAKDRRADLDACALYTDGQTWAGPQHPVQAMTAYRSARVAEAKMVSVAVVGYGNSVVDGSDAGMLDVVGFDTAAPVLIADFIRGEA